jgi:transposase
VLQFAEDQDDRGAAHAVRGRIDWKYLLALPLDDPGFHYSVLSTFRDRVLAGGLEYELFNAVLDILRTQGVLNKRGNQRTDSTHVLAAVRDLNRLECVGEALRYALNTLARVHAAWLQAWVPAEWFDRYGQRFEQYRLPSSKTERQALAELIGRDGTQLLQQCYAVSAPGWLREVPAVDILRQVWVQQYYTEDSHLRWRTAEEVPPGEWLIQSPYDVEARYSTKRSNQWTGYKVHLTETCDPDQPRLFTNVETTASTTPDVAVTTTIHQQLQERQLLPATHLVDAGYVDADILVTGQDHYGVTVLGPVPPDTSWQARAAQGFAAACFVIDWEAQVVTCPQGQQSVLWSPSHDSYDNPTVNVRFAKHACLTCAQRAQCTHAREGPRTLKLRTKEQHHALQAGRQRQKTAAFKAQYRQRAGVEGAISQATRCFGLRRTRYIGLAKTHLQHLLTAVALNLMRLADWWGGHAPTPTRGSPFAALAPT